MCDKCEKVVKRDSTSKFSYRSPQSMRDKLYGQAVELDVCTDCLESLTNGWASATKELAETQSEGTFTWRHSNPTDRSECHEYSVRGGKGYCSVTGEELVRG